MKLFYYFFNIGYYETPITKEDMHLININKKYIIMSLKKMF